MKENFHLTVMIVTDNKSFKFEFEFEFENKKSAYWVTQIAHT